MRMKIYKVRNEILVAACDCNLVGKCFTEGELQLVVSESFYGDEEVELETFIAQLKIATIANLVGEEVITKALEAGFVDKNGIIKVKGVPHAQIVKII